MLATALDPRFRALKFLNDDQKVTLKTRLKSLARDVCVPNSSDTTQSDSSTDTDTPPPVKRRKSAFDVLQDYLNVRMSLPPGRCRYNYECAHTSSYLIATCMSV